MKIVENNKSITQNLKLFRELTDKHLKSLLNDRKTNQQKILEISHAGKFLMLFNTKIVIDQLSEKPDFILKMGRKIIGLEHQIVVDNKPKAREGFFENIFSIAESELQTDSKLPFFLANCYIKPYANFKLKDKSKLISIIKKVVKEYVLNDILIDNPLIDQIIKMPHSQINISVNLGAWWQKNITEDIIQKAIKKKEKLLPEYKQNSVNIQWLLIVIGSNGDSSYIMDRNINIDIASEFDKIFILEDFYNNLYELK